MNNLGYFKRLKGKCYLGVSFIVDQKNAEQVFSFCKRLKDTGVDSVKISPCIVSNDGKENNRYHQSIFTAVKEQIQSAAENLADAQFEIYDAYHELDEKFEKKYIWCPFLQILPVIGADLNVYSCQDKAYNLKEGLIGSIKDISFKKFWLKDKSKFFKINPSLHCNHHCVANQKNKTIFNYLHVHPDHVGFV
jgi:MoaA/NifB/PqqE/SkfB family radical SAM enzyme